MAAIRKRINKAGSVAYHVQVRMKGYSTQTATFNRLTDARKWISSTESAIREGRHFKTAEAKKHTLADAVDRYLKDVLPQKKPHAHKVQAAQLNRWKVEIGRLLLADVTPSVIAEVRDKLLSETTLRGKRSPSTVVRYMAVLSHLFTVMVNEWEWLEDSPMRRVKKPKEPRGRVRFLSDEERTRLLKACNESSSKWLFTCVVLALATGMRKGELMNLKWQDVFLNDGFLILHETKNDERRRIPLSGQALSLLNEHAKVRRLDTDLLFPGGNSNKPIDLRKPWISALDQAEINDFRFHDLRHSTASYLVMNGASLAEIAEILGHKTLQMVKRYSHLSDSHVSNVLADMNAKVFGS